MAAEDKVYVVCPAHAATGGTEALHSLCHELNLLGIDAKIFYVDIRHDMKIVPRRFEKFNAPYVTRLDDSPNACLVVPETKTDMLRKYPLMRKSIWWLSVDNYTRPWRLCGPRDFASLIKYHIFKKKIDFTDETIQHLCQSYYALDYVKKNGARTNAHLLMDYLGDEHLHVAKAPQNKENIVLYNPLKGLRFTRKIIRSAKGRIKFSALENMTPDEVHDLCSRAKIYIDFGNHPGKDRFPREAAMSGCIIITSLRGAAAYKEDVPIPDCYKFNDTAGNIPSILRTISDCIAFYSKKKHDFDTYRDFIMEDKARFIRQIKNIFCKP